MKIKPESLESDIELIRSILSELHKEELRYKEVIEPVHPSFQKSAPNLIHYRALRKIDITGLQKRIGNIGLSRIARSESHVIASLQNCRDILKALIKDTSQDEKYRRISIKKSSKTLNTHSKDLLGYRSKGRRVRIMVTLPSEAAFNYNLVHSLIESGMNTARINCAHDGPDEWKKMIEYVSLAKKRLRKNCKISMDLAGPKIRTGALEPGPQVRRFRPVRNEYGQVIDPAILVFVTALSQAAVDEIPVDRSWLQSLDIGHQVTFTDARNKKRSFTVKEIKGSKVIAHGMETSYIQTGTELHNTNQSCLVGELPALEQSLLLKIGDELRITKDKKPGRPIQYDDEGLAIEKAFVSCTSEEIFNYVKEGEKILFDDGKITGIVRTVTPDEMRVEIIHAKLTGSSLKADKGINLPETDLKISGLTPKDREDLKFVVQYADVINFSFVNTPEDVRELLEELKNLDAENKLGIILKIETQSAFNNLTAILLEGMKNYPLGVMIARGDLAIEAGWENMARIQQEIISLCHAGHVPVVWATQVLETLAKKGIPSRSEITDAATSLNAECVMLNKGPYIHKAIELLDYMLKSLNEYRDHNENLSPIMEVANSITNSRLATAPIEAVEG
ncbi:MAG: pyruvate kinase [Bacteroidota bacterium]